MIRSAVVLLSACSFKASCNAGNRLDMDQAKGFVSEAVAQETGVKPTSVSCPKEVKPEKDASFACTFEVGGVQGTLTMKQTDTKGTVVPTAMTGIIASSNIESAVGAVVHKRDPSLTVDCGARVHPSKPGDVLTCDVRSAEQVVGRATITINDEDNNVTIKIEPVGATDTETTTPSPPPSQEPTRERTL